MPSDDDKKCRVAVCDDVAAFRDLLILVLSTSPDVEFVGQAANGREAVELVGEVEPDILLLDLAMPVMDGMEALPFIREASPDTQVVVVTGFGNSELRERALELGATEYIEKGGDPSRIVQAALDACRQST